MKKIPVTILILALILIGFYGCNPASKNSQESSPEVPNTMPPSIFVDGAVYSTTGEEIPIEPDPSNIKTASGIVPGSRFPAKDGEINFPLENASYAHITDSEEYVVVSINNEWQKFIKNANYIPSPGKYLMKDARIVGGSWIYLRADWTFSFMRDLATSYVPQGSYRVSGEDLILEVSDEEYYIFKIEGDQLILKEGTNIEELVPLNSVFVKNEVEQIIKGSPDRFTEKEIRTGMSLIEETFSFPGATLNKLWYEETEASKLSASYRRYGRGQINGVKEENVLVILSEFITGDKEDNPVLNPNSTYTDYQWILIRDSKDNPWRIDDQGY